MVVNVEMPETMEFLGSSSERAESCARCLPAYFEACFKRFQCLVFVGLNGYSVFTVTWDKYRDLKITDAQVTIWSDLYLSCFNGFQDFIIPCN